MRALIQFLALFSLSAHSAFAIGQNTTIGFEQSSGSIKLATQSSYVQLLLDGSDWAGVLRAAGDLAIDFGRVTGLNGSVVISSGNTTVNGTAPRGIKGGVIISGTIGRSSLIDGLINAGKFDVKGINGSWEAFTSTVVKSPVPGVSEALVIAGSDKRGTIYGLYDISEQIGVSPWYWWADVPAKSHREIYALPKTKVQGSPSVKYRGFFINDEAPALTGFVKQKYGGAGYTSQFYAKVFELLLRSRANYLWPAMWGNMFDVDDPKNQPLADEYGIVMSTSHTEPMMRATNEWPKFGTGNWQWSENNASIFPFFVEGAKRAKNYESVFTVGMRGYHDTAMSGDIVTSQLESVVTAQRQIIKDVFGSETAVPQSWCLYKEVQGYYEAGMTVPDDVTLLWTDDNFGNIRRLPIANETGRSGGAGVYYHFDYVGDPRSYKWINTVHLQKTWEQMTRAYELGAKDIWVVNVGDIKGVEIPITHFFDIAYDITLWGPDSITTWLNLWATREFGPDQAEDIAKVMNSYSKLVGRRKYELVDSTTYSILNYEEADTVLNEWNDLVDLVQTINDDLDDNLKSSFFELVLHPVTAGATVYDIHISAAKNRLYSQQWRSSANAMAQHVLEKFALDHKLTKQYNTMLNGKWAHIMDQTHLNYGTYWQQPMRQATPPLFYIQTLEQSLAGDLGVAIEGSNATVPGDDQWHPNSSNSLSLQPIDPYGKSRWIDVFSVGTEECTWTIQAEPFVKLTKTTGTLSPTGETDTRVYVSIDWSKAPAKSGVTTLNITSSNAYGAQFSMPTITLPYNRTQAPSTFASGFVESDAYISIEAEHYSRSSASNATTGVKYITLPDYGRTLSGVTLYPFATPSQSTASGPDLEYNFYTFTPVTNPLKAANITVLLGTSINFNPTQPLRYAVQVDSRPVQIVSYIKDQPKNIDPNPIGWPKAVSDGAWTTIVTINGTLEAGPHTLKFWALEPGVVLQKLIIDLGGVKESYLGPPESYRV